MGRSAAWESKHVRLIVKYRWSAVHPWEAFNSGGVLSGPLCSLGEHMLIQELWACLAFKRTVNGIIIQSAYHSAFEELGQTSQHVNHHLINVQSLLKLTSCLSHLFL